MKKQTLFNTLANLNDGHDYILDPYWVKDGWLIRLKMPSGKYVQGDDVHTMIYPTGCNINIEISKLQDLADLRNQVEAYGAVMISNPHSDGESPDGLESLNLPNIDDLDLPGVPKDPTRPDVGRGPCPYESVFYNIPAAELIASRWPLSKPRKLKKKGGPE